MNRIAVGLLILLVAVPAFAGDATSEGDSPAGKHIKAGLDYLERGDTEVMKNSDLLRKAENAFMKAIDLDADSALAHYHLGVTHLALDDTDGALLDYENLKELDAEMAEDLRAKIEDYTPPGGASKVGVSGVIWVQPRPTCPEGETFIRAHGTCEKIESPEAASEGAEEKKKEEPQE
jgi:tetratricopeptide (TPR) repeat protein